MSAVDAMLELNTQHLHTDELPWVKEGTGVFRLLLFRPEQNLVVTHWRLPAGTVSGVHRHAGPVTVYTMAGIWSHRPDVMEYRPGTFVSEPVGALHRFHAGPGEVEGLGYSFGDTEAFNEDGELTGTQTQQSKVDRYFELCEAQGFGRPK